MPKIDIAAIPPILGSSYPAPLDVPTSKRRRRSVTDGTEITDFGANHVTLPPGSWSSQRHWHEGEDELVVILSGAATLIDDKGRHPMTAGDVAVFPKNDGNGHHLVNEGDRDCVLIALGKAEESPCHYPDVDLLWTPEGGETHADGTPYD